MFMKKSFLTLTVVLAALTTKAQEVGQMWIGGSFGISASEVKDGDSQVSYRILPEFGYVISDNIGIGISGGFAHTEGAGIVLDNSRSTIEGSEQEGFVVNPFVRYSFLKGDLGALFLDGGVGYTHAKDRKNDDKATLLEVGARPGVAFNVSDKISLTAKFGFIGYQHLKDETVINNQKQTVKTSVIGIDLDMRQILVGMALKF
ncbi:MAG: hypothetical protein RL662_1658 [Bacteroidota bacterium]|jgi:hypothetical protein